MIRFLADESLNHHIVAACLRREPALDFLSAANARINGMPDLEVLSLAANQGRILGTHDIRTIPRYFGEFLAGGESSAGVFLVNQRVPVATVADWLVLVWAASDTGEWENRIVEIPF